jgi:hypothetical protein
MDTDLTVGSTHHSGTFLQLFNATFEKNQIQYLLSFEKNQKYPCISFEKCKSIDYTLIQERWFHAEKRYF